MDFRTDAMNACDANWKERVARAVAAYAEAYAQAEGTSDAAAKRQQAGERMKAGLKLAQAVRESSRALVDQTFS